jgi:hypothetical protein
LPMFNSIGWAWNEKGTPAKPPVRLHVHAARCCHG